ncbi:hypothetical protein Pint_20623 [Pistacia integerrima]|uniref:Uncharacterized protein n=1 Tax=Pistacia integerrima TaxID=434235 RepID=A0ACC0XC88_9ROSI|nr:hypothetical protein Pint_20623 [Pistacia integerrima]
MNSTFSSISLYPIVPADTTFSGSRSVTLTAQSSRRTHRKKVPKNLRNPRRSKLPPDFGVNLFLKKPSADTDLSTHILILMMRKIKTEEMKVKMKNKTVILFGNQKSFKRYRVYFRQEFLKNLECYIEKGLCHSFTS